MSERYERFEQAPVQNNGARIRPDKDPLNRWEGWESAPKFLKEFVERFNNYPTTDGKTFMEQVIRELYMTPREQRRYMRPDPIPHAYRANYQELKNAHLKLNANPTGLTIEQILAVDRHFHRVYVNNNIAAQILQRAGSTSYMSGKKWEIKHHELTNYGWPQFSHDFRDLGFIQVGPEGKKSTGYGWGAAYEIPFTTIDMAAGGRYDPDYWSVFFLSQQMGIFGDERIWLGGAGRNTTGKGAPNLKGLCNHGSRTTLTSPSTDGGFSGGLADFNDWFSDMKTSWKSNSVFEDAMNVAVTTPGIATETLQHDSTAGDLKTLWQQLRDKWFASSREFDAWYVSENIISTAIASITNTTQNFFAGRIGPATVRRTVVYPLQRKILSEKFKTYPDDIAFAYITGDILQVYHPAALITYTSGSNCISQLKGWQMNGLFMDSTVAGQRAYQPPIRA